MGGTELEEGVSLKLDYSKLEKVASKKCDVVPVVVQDSRTGRVLIVAYVNELALAETFKRRVCCLWSTSRNELWVKGATSGDTLELDDVFVNCEQNSLLMLCHPRRKGACHTKDAHGQTRVSCYYRRLRGVDDMSCPSCTDQAKTDARQISADDDSMTLAHLGEDFVPHWTFSTSTSGAVGGQPAGRVSVATATAVAVVAAAAASLATAAALSARLVRRPK